MKFFLTLLFMIGLVETTSFAQSPGVPPPPPHMEMKKDKTEMTKEQREQKAVMLEKMVTCLRSDRPMKECHEEMRAACGKDMENCMMDKMMMKKHKKMMHNEDNK